MLAKNTDAGPLLVARVEHCMLSRSPLKVQNLEWI